MESNRNGSLPEELVNEILLRLPVKALLVCKCVCKNWYGLIKSSSFIKQHYSHESNEGSLLFRSQYGVNQSVYNMYEDDEIQYRAGVSDHLTQLPTDRRATHLMGPENGIFCVVSNRKRIGLLNPAIREFRILPPYPFYDPLAFRICSVIGFGLDPSSGDFKVVAFQRSKSQNSAYVYNLSSDSWKSIEAVEALDLFVFFDFNSSNRILNGVNHWVIKFDNRNVPSILAFDMRTEKFQDISIPDALTETKRILRVTVYGDLFALMSFKHEECVDLWVMGRDGLWSKRFSIGPLSLENVWPLCLWKKNLLFFESSSAPLSMIDISTQKVKTLIQETDQELYVSDHFVYKESLVSIKGKRAYCFQDLYELEFMTCIYSLQPFS